MSWWEEGCLNYAIEIGKKYKADRQRILDCLNCDSVINFLNESYTILTGSKELDPIENLSQEEKLRLWDIALTYEGNKKKRILICRAVYLLNRITER